jgi:hypothetical protein
LNTKKNTQVYPHKTVTIDAQSHMKIIIAHSGVQVDLGPFTPTNHHLRSQQQQQHAQHSQSGLSQSINQTILALKQWIAHQTNIALQNQILLNSTGLKLEDEQPVSSVENENIFVFDRVTFVQSPHSHNNSYGSFEPIRPTEGNNNNHSRYNKTHISF